MSSVKEWPLAVKVCLILLIGLILATLVLVGFPGESNATVVSVQSHKVADGGRDIVTTGVTPVSARWAKAFLARDGDNVTQGGDDNYWGKVNCKRRWRTINYNRSGINVVRSHLDFVWCYNNKRVTDHGANLECEALVAAFWDVTDQGKSGFYKGFDGSPYGAYEQHAKCSYRGGIPSPWGPISWVNHYHTFAAVGFDNGGFRWL